MQPMNQFLVDHTDALKAYINEASTCLKEPPPRIYSVDLEREYSQFLRFVVSVEPDLLASKSPGIIALLKAKDVATRRLEHMNQMAFGDFLKMDDQ